MNYTGPVFRPPFEANSLLLQVTVGCSHNDCSFCTMYKDVQFRMSSMQDIEADLQEAKTQLKKLNDAGMDFSLNIITGAAETEKYMQNAIANAELLNEVQPYLIFVATLHVDPGSQLLEDMKAGRFVENTLGQCLEEEIEMVKRL